MNILVTGCNGQLGNEIKNLAALYNNFCFFFKDLPELDICNTNQINSFLTNNKIDVVINCAAYTAVDKAEENVEIAKNVNSQGVLNLVNSIAKVNGKLIHISTDYVFDGNNFFPYKELDRVNPIGVYGNTKRGGELAVINSDIDGIVIRTSWLYSFYGHNFVKTILKLGDKRKDLEVVFDQIGSPTNASDLAKACLDILYYKKGNRLNSNGKLYHYSNEGVASWYDFAIAIMNLGNLSCNVIPIETKDYSSAAKRPHYSVLNKAKIKHDFAIKIPYWKDSLEKCIKKLNNN